MNTPKMITVHCADSKNGDNSVDADEIRRWHTDPPPKGRGWKDIGYHFVVKVDGTIQMGRPVDEVGAHVEGHNQGNIGICLPGKDRFSQAQFESLKTLIAHLSQTFRIASDQLFCHYEFDTAKAQGKSCPNIKSEDLKRWLQTGSLEAIKSYLLA